MQHYGYIPGICNASEQLSSRWYNIGTAGIAVALSLWLFFFLTGFPGYWMLGLIIPSWLGFLGIWQSSLPSCVFAGPDAGFAGSRRFRAALPAILLATAVLGAGLLVSPMPESEMRKAYTRAMEGFLSRIYKL